MQNKKENILVVDDDPTLVRLSERILTSLGYHVWTATSGLEACRILQENKDQIDLVILDFMMPGMSGEETLLRLREINPHVRILLSSGYSREGKAKTLIDEGIQGFIQKPFVMQELDDAVRKALDKVD
ncbi:MAG: hypothetical protein CO150_08025 [Nitrospirae bacterium CG_4_9_14_3_um_filter_53_35]|nr:MAG: hypothetical protein AUK29_02460 [Nitrospirae bacterium CG2_30_53_67]PIS37673.1 MAG: hypothetical protein COT35_04680 [Nitrospirae bacterium CG08_land_8_20_14_0_20_52_24]PIV85220.1 MAG: hypothetical protein COW52_03395 [Nitrospirae bacterium CG17_big_fil_post_rev_8_21_14_2_50_50_9]PIW86173.1 MAG: hypothetical protein COZ95_00790 [Nitrospirae bacterium CG_4_8_14_3_um_filter_50_41]PIX86202.1 MAG: hypothetical protein COZ32_04545 [Nitrospirae bacterium CG_4_10_14_3_um_filter_53_41]PJA7345